jgi:prepilin-type N-terminal cleavage/methylation domain-containing protein
MRPHAPRPITNARRGFTLAEMIMATTMLGLFGASAITFYLRCVRSVTQTAGRNDAQQNASYALNYLDHDVRVAGTGLVAGQPLLLEARGDAIAFNGDLITTDTSATSSGSYYDPSIADTVALAWQASRAGSLPLSSVAYPDSTYYASGGTSGPLANAETIQFWVKPDSSSPYPNRYVLLKRVNNNAPTVVTSNIYLTSSSPPVFQYWKANPNQTPGGGNNVNALLPVPSSALPLYHVLNDTAQQNKLNAIKEVRITITSAYRDPRRGTDILRTVNEQIAMPNASAAQINQCGGSPGAPASVTAIPSSAGKDTVGLSWPNSPDDGAGRNSVRMYLIYRKVHTDSIYVPMFSVTAAGSAAYTWSDTQVTLGKAYDYSVAARDCTPSLSSFVYATNVTPN